MFNNVLEFPWLKRASPGSAWPTMGYKVRSQVVDAASITSLLGYALDSFVVYAAYAVIRDWLSPPAVLEEEVEPHADTNVESMPSDQLTSQNVKFLDDDAGYAENTKSTFDSIRDAALTTDATLDEFFSRPLRIASFDWGVGTTLTQRFDPWSLYFSNPRVINRISNYKLMRANLHVKFTINGNAFHYGRAICSYNPLRTYDDVTVDRAFVDADLVAASQRPHVYLNPTESQGGEMKLPFFYPYNVWDIVAEDWSKMGEIVVHSMQGLKHANGATDTVSINVFAWAEDVRFAIPTNWEPGSITPQADEYGKGPVSRIAGAIANAAGSMTMIPTIGPFARATEIGASAVGAMAALFGYSSPTRLEYQQYRPVAATNLAVTNMQNDSQKMTVDAKQEITLDPKTVGLDNADELVITSIAKRESWLTNFPWEVGSAKETLLFNVLVDPAVHQKFGDEIHMPACCFASVPFRFWRGSLKYRFQFVCSNYHKGRVKIVYDPTGTPPSGTAEYNTAYTTIVDISEQSDFEIVVGWGQKDPYRKSPQVGSFSNTAMFNLDPLTYNSSTLEYGNGTLSVYVVNELTVPNTTINNDIEVNVFISAGDDFEVAVPWINNVEVLHLRDADIGNRQVEPQAEEMSPSDSAPSGGMLANTNANIIETTDQTNMVYFGESIKSFRQLLKRYNRHSFLCSDAAASGVRRRMFSQRKAFPHQVGWMPSSFPASGPTKAVTGGKYTYGYTTLLNYLTPAYGGWRGSVRWMLDISQIATANDSISVTRTDDAPSEMDVFANLTSSTTVAGLASMQNTSLLATRMGNGTVYQNSGVNPLVMFEVPYYKNLRFTPAKRFEVGDTDEFQPGFITELVYTTPDDNEAVFIPTFCSAGEDFNCFYFLGAPIMYYTPTAPSS